MGTSTPSFPSTLPQGVPELMRASEFQRYLDELGGEAADSGHNSRLTSLSPSLLQDLQRFERDGQRTELLEVLAAAMRHTQPLAIHLQSGDQVITLSIFPAARLVHCPLRLEEFLAGPLEKLVVMQVEPATLRPPGYRDQSLVGEPGLYAPLGQLLWAMALRGARDDLLPELAGQAAYRVSPGVNLRTLGLAPELAVATGRLRRQTCNLREISEWPGMDRVLAQRLLNGLYLQAGLIVSRTHPAATNEGWFGYR